MKRTIASIKSKLLYASACLFILISSGQLHAQTLSFPGAQGFGRFATGARGAASPQVYIVSNLNDKGAGSFRDAVSQPGRFVVFTVGGIVRLETDIVVAPNTTVAAQTATGDGIVFFNKRITFSSSSNTICRFLRIRLGATNNSGNDASGLANGSNIIFDHMSVTWGMDENFSINWDNKGTAPDNITIQNSIIGQALHRENHSAGGLIQTPDGGRVSLIRNLYISNKTRNPKVKGVNEFVNNVVYNWGNGNRLDTNLNYGWSGDAYIMGGSSGVSEVNVINNYFVGGPLTPPDKTTPFSRGTGTFNIWGSGNYFDNNKNGVLDGALVPFDASGYPGIEGAAFRSQAYPYPAANPALSAQQAYQLVIDSVGSCYPRRDQVDALMVDEVKSYGTKGLYVYRETALPFSNGGLGDVFSGQAPKDTDSDGMPDAWEDANGLNKNSNDAIAFNTTYPQYMNIEVYINSLISTPPAVFIKPPTILTINATSTELPAAASQVVLTWADNSDNETNFVLERSEDGINFTQLALPAANTTNYTDNTGIPNKTYYYRIKAVTADDASGYSVSASVKTPPIPTAPSLAATPSPDNGFQYAEISGGKLTLKWTGSANTTSYTVYFGTSPTALIPKTTIAYSAAPSYEITGLTDLTTYYWRIDASNAKGNAEGNVWSFRTTKVIPAGLVGQWSFDEIGEGNQVTDSTAYLNHGILGLDDDDASIRTTGKKKGALNFATADVNRYVVSIPNKDQIYLDKSSFSVSFWMKAPASLIPPGTSTSAYLLCKGSITKNLTTGATGKRFNVEFKANQFRFAIDDDVNKDELSTAIEPFFTGDWVHVVIIRDTTDKKLRIYLNGSLNKESTTATKALGIGEASSLILGNIGELEFLAGSNTPAPYKGSLDELKIYNYALTYPEIVTLFYGSAQAQKPYSPSYNNVLVDGYSDTLKLAWQGGVNTSKYRVYAGTDPLNLVKVSDSTALAFPSYSMVNIQEQTNYYWRVDAIGPLGTTTGDVWSFKSGNTKGLAAHYALDEASGTAATDSSKFLNHGTLKDMPNAVRIDGKFNKALGFGKPGGTGAITVPDAPQIRFDNNSFSISMWVKLPAYSSTSKQDCYLLQKGTFEATTGKWYGIQLKDRTLTFAIDDGITKVNADVSLAASTTYDIFNKGWVHIVALRDRSINRIRVYVNNSLAKSVDESTVTGTIGKSDNLLIGNSAENKAFPDSLDDVRLYNYALSEPVITKLYNGQPLLKKAATPAPADKSAGMAPERVTLGWTDPSATATSYRVYFGTSPDSLKLKGTVSTPSLNADSLKTSSNYYWKIESANESETVMGDTWMFTTGKDVKPPTVITKPATIVLSATGTATLLAADINNGSNDVYGIDTVIASQTAFTCANLGNNTITLSVKDKNGNIATGTATVTVTGTKPGKPVTPVSIIICNGTNTTLTTTSANAVTYQWLYENATISGATSITYNSGRAGRYRVLGISAQACKSDTSDAGTININSDTSFTISKDTTISRGSSVTLKASGSVGTIQWSPSANLTTATGTTTVATPVTNTRYMAVLTNTQGCQVSRYSKVTLRENTNTAIEYTHVITANGDGVNDRLVIDNITAYPNNMLQIFDQSGKKVFEKSGYSNEWDGRLNGNILNNGTYYFILKINNEVRIKGSVTIVH